MSPPSITVSNLSKKYVIQHESRHDNLRDTLHHTVRKMWRRMRWGTRFETEDFWALKDISFSINSGEVLGIIGRNGAGKSTLLKTLSRITEPTSGSITLRGRVASLLEVGTGFHPELTGRENIFLNGAILGMSRAEIRKKFDEIVDFAEVERFLDTPVKRYSSGMYVRLAFSVAAHLEPEILIVDEVLAVGDIAFQKKCLGKMEEVARGSGRTVIFVSHNMIAVRELTHRCLYLKSGELYDMGPTSAVLDHYALDARQADPSGKRGKHSRIVRAHMISGDGRSIVAHEGSELTLLEVDVQTNGRSDLILECFLQDGGGQKLGICSPGHFRGWRLPAEAGHWRVLVSMRLPPLASGTYYFDVVTTSLETGFDHYEERAAICEVHALKMRPAEWELRRDHQAGFFVMDGEVLPQVHALLDGSTSEN